MDISRPTPTLCPEAVCTVIACNYLAHARTLAESLRQFHPDVPCYVLLIDYWEEHFDPAQEVFTVLSVETLNIPDLASLRFKYDVTEFATAVKPYLFNYLLNRAGVEKLLYLDPDILVTAPLTGLFGQLDTFDYVLTPHLDSDYPNDGESPSMHSQMVTGVFNLGFLGMRRSPGTQQMVEWLERNLHNHCIVDYQNGYFVDQKFFDVAISIFPNVHIERAPGYNMAPWNVHSRQLSQAEDGTWRVNDTPLFFYHFSNYRAEIPERIAIYTSRYTLAQRTDLAPLYAHYRARLYHHGFEQCRAGNYQYDFFTDGAPISKETRQHYYRHAAQHGALGDPFASPKLQKVDRFFRQRRRVFDLTRRTRHSVRNALQSFLRRLTS